MWKTLPCQETWNWGKHAHNQGTDQGNPNKQSQMNKARSGHEAFVYPLFPLKKKEEEDWNPTLNPRRNPHPPINPFLGDSIAGLLRSNTD